jgi:hypothetical protein
MKFLSYYTNFAEPSLAICADAYFAEAGKLDEETQLGIRESTGLSNEDTDQFGFLPRAKRHDFVAIKAL